MATIDFSLDSRVKKSYVPLISQQRHLRHIKRIAARNIKLSSIRDNINENNISFNEMRDDLGFRFTIHDINEELLYESETVYSTSPSWKTFESSSFKSPSIGELIVRLYYCQTFNNRESSKTKCVQKIKSTKSKPIDCPIISSNDLFLEWKTHLSGLVFIGEEIPKDNRFKENTVIFGLMEGFYTSLDCIASDELLNQLCLPQESISVSDLSTLRNSYCLNVLYRIEMMQRVITQTWILVNNTRTKLEDKLHFFFDKSELNSKVEFMEMKVKCLRNELFLSTERLNKSRETKVKNESDICEKGIDMLNKFQHLKQERESLLEKRKKLDQSKERLTKTRAQLMIRRKQLISDIARIYPLVPFPDGNGGFSICGVHLPNSEDFEGHDQTMISIAIGYVAHILVMISRLLDVSLRYQIIYYGSRSSIVDHINDKISENDRIFPLHTKSGKDKLHFKYGVFLINKNIAQLRHYLGLQTRDLSATLPNLYGLLREKLVFLNEETVLESMPSSSTNTPNARPLGFIDDYLRRELEVMRNQQEIQEFGHSRDNLIHMRKLSNISNNSNHLPVINDNKTLSRSLDKGLNEIVTHKKNIYTDQSISSSVSSEGHFNSIPKHLLDSNQIHHNLSEDDLNLMIDRNKSKNYRPFPSKNHQMKWSENSDEELNNGNGCASSSDSSPRVNVWNEGSDELPSGAREHSQTN